MLDVGNSGADGECSGDLTITDPGTGMASVAILQAAARKDVFGAIETKLLATERVSTNNNCVPRDMTPVGSRFIFGYTWASGNTIQARAWGFEGDQQGVGDGIVGVPMYYAIGPPLGSTNPLNATLRSAITFHLKKQEKVS